ncbi:MAG TPA: FHA domain-containing protein [Thermomicrobiales bacterium]|nr:FHA domain-containing protein [Thermomicrobiales bacterium]
MDLFDSASLSFDWFILALRIAFIALIYLFLYQVARVSIRELVAMGSAAPDDSVPTLPAPSTALEMLDPAESSHEPGTRFPLDHYSTVGRRDDNTIVIDDAFVSGTHAQLTYDHGAWWLQDLSSTNGTAVNGQRVTSRVQLRRNDIVQFGRVSLRADLD